MNGKDVCVHAVKTRDGMEVSCQFHAPPAFARAKSVIYALNKNDVWPQHQCRSCGEQRASYGSSRS
jgi:hypothetical protein